MAPDQGPRADTRSEIEPGIEIGAGLLCARKRVESSSLSRSNDRGGAASFDRLRDRGGAQRRRLRFFRPGFSSSGLGSGTGSDFVIGFMPGGSSPVDRTQYVVA